MAPKILRGMYETVRAVYLHHFPEHVAPAPRDLPDAEIARRALFLVEESMEYAQATNLEQRLDALVDVVIVALGAAAMHGFHRFEEALQRVSAANMQKVRGASGRRGEWTMDLRKPLDWKAADLSDLASPIQDLRETSPGLETVTVTRPALAFPLSPDSELIPRFRSGGSRHIGIDKVHPILLECAALLNRKSQDYGDPDYSKASYHPYGHASYCQMLHTKFLRLQTLTVNDKSGKRPNFESVRDTVLDLINYAAFYASWMDEQEAAQARRDAADAAHEVR